MRAYAFILSLSCAMLSGLAWGFYWGKEICDRGGSTIVYAPPEKHSDGSLTLERKPDSVVTPRTAIPKGDKLDRTISVVVGSRRPPDTIAVRDTVVVCPPCPPVRVDLSVSSGPSGSHVTASSPDGEILSGVDIPITERVISPKPRVWRIGLAGDPIGRRVGLSVHRDLGPLYAGLAGAYWPLRGTTMIAEVGINF